MQNKNYPMRVICIIFLLIYSQIVIVAQNIHIVPFKQNTANFKTQNITRKIIGTDRIIDYSFLKNIPSDLNLFAVYSVLISPSQKMYDDFLNGKISQEKYEEYIKSEKIDTSLLLKDSKGSNKFYLYVGLNKSNMEKTVIIDCNSNADFSDDNRYTFKLNKEKYNFPLVSEQDSLCPLVNIQTISLNDGNSLNRTISLTLNPFMTFDSEQQYPSSDDYYLDVIFLTNQYSEANFKINDQQISIFEHKNSNDLIFNNLNTNSVFKFYYKNTELQDPYKIGDTLILCGEKIYLKDVFKDSLYLQVLDKQTDSSIIGNKIPCLYAKNINDKKIINLNDLFKNKFVFIDFWGSWCKPCIAAIPDLKILYEKIKNRKDVIIIGVALEKDSSLDKISNIIETKNVKWMNVWNDFDQLNSLSSVHRKMRITHFPTYYIVDKQGVIVYNTKNRPYTECFEEAVEKFLKLIE